MSFQDFSKDIVKDFLGSVVYVDDIIFSREAPVENEQVIIPQRGNQIVAIDQDERNNRLEPNFNPKELTKAFSNYGILCSLLESEEHGDNLFIKNTLQKSDIIILDWSMYRDNGEMTCNFINSILEKDKERGISLRLITIYTNQQTYSDIIRNRILPIFNNLGLISDISDDDCVLYSGHTKVIVLTKNPAHGNHSVTDTELPDRIIKEFTDLTSGLISNAALKAISVIRQNTHKILDSYSNDLDPAFLAHRALLPNFSDADHLLKESLINSFSALIDYNKIEESTSSKHISNWISDKIFSDKFLTLQNQHINITKDDRKNWQNIGFLDAFTQIWNAQKPNMQLSEKKLDKLYRNDLHKNVIDYFIPDDFEANNLNEKFSILTHHKSNYTHPSYTPKLTLGTIIKGNKSTTLWICIQQRCDSVRINNDEQRRFLFLPIEIVENGKFNFVIKENNHFIKLRLGTVSYNLRTIRFKATKDEMVLARKFGKSKKYFFIQKYKKGHPNYDSDYDENFEWVMDLKDAHAQRVVNKYISNLSRIGLDESEWLRRWSE